MLFEILEKYKDENGAIDYNNEELKAEIKQYEDSKAEEFENTIAKGLKDKNQELISKINQRNEEYETLNTRLQELETKKAEDNGDYKTIAESLRNQIKQLEDQKNQELDGVSKVNQALKEQAVDGYTRNILKENGVDPDLIDFILPEFKSKADIEIKEDGGYSIKAKLGDDSLDFDEYAKETLKHDRYKRVLLAPQDEGGNAPGNGSKSFDVNIGDQENPWKTGNLTKQIEIKESNPALAEKLQNQKD